MINLYKLEFKLIISIDIIQYQISINVGGCPLQNLVKFVIVKLCPYPGPQICCYIFGLYFVSDKCLLDR